MRHSTANTISIMCSCLMSALVICVMIAPDKPASVKPMVKAEIAKPVVLKKPGKRKTKPEQYAQEWEEKANALFKGKKRTKAIDVQELHNFSLMLYGTDAEATKAKAYAAANK